MFNQQKTSKNKTHNFLENFLQNILRKYLLIFLSMKVDLLLIKILY